MPQQSTISVPVPTDTFLALYEFLKGESVDLDPVEAVERAIDYWIDNASWKPEMSERKRTSAAFRWKEVSLPDGTEVRMKYRGEYHYARIEGDAFLVEGARSSPSQFAHAVTNTSRNAWRDLEVKRPHDRTWMLAAKLRREK
ncbi:MAG: hypothetical protein KF777_24890 [Planctomycetaceae bacterium]|nr:hypothetical protein [Planctomycetaceae bacterium]